MVKHEIRDLKFLEIFEFDLEIFGPKIEIIKSAARLKK